MNLNRKSFTYRLYSWCYILSNKLFNKDSDWDGDIIIPTNANLCPMMRTIFLWTPVYLAILSALIFGLGYILFYLPNQFGGTVGYMNTYLIPGIVIGGIVGFIWGLVKISSWIDQRPSETIIEMEARHAVGNYTFWEMIGNYFKAKHEKICPIITIVEDVSVEEVKPGEGKKSTTKKPSTEKTPVANESTAETPVANESTEKTPVANESTEKTPVANKSTAEKDKAVDDITETLDKLEERTASNTNESVDIKFLNKFSPNFMMFTAAAAVIGVVALLNIGMAYVMQSNEVIFERAVCTASFAAENRYGVITCGNFTKTNAESVAFIADAIILMRSPICEVTKGTLTDDINFDCEYK